MGSDLLRKLTEQVPLFIIPSSSNIFLPGIRSILSWISDTRVYTSNLCPWILNTGGIMNKAGTKAPLPTCKCLVADWKFWKMVQIGVAHIISFRHVTFGCSCV